MAENSSSMKKAVVDYYSSTCSYDNFHVYDPTSLNAIPAPPHMQAFAANIHEDVHKRFLGCDFPKAAALKGCSVLDLGCGHGRDVFILSQMVGPDGHVTGVDLTPKSVQFLESMIDYHMKKFGYTKSNVKAMVASADDLSAIRDSTVDVVLCNGLTCQVPNKIKMLREIFRVLKPGGEFCHLDPICSGQQFEELRNDEILWAEGFGGSFYWKDFIGQCQEVGFLTPLFVSINPMNYKEDGVKKIFPNEQLFQRFKQLRWGDALYRVFKADASTSSPCFVTYNGGVLYFEDEYQLDVNYTFKKGDPVMVTSQIAAILEQSRFAPYFTFDPIQVDVKTRDPLVNPFEWMDKKCQK